MDEFLCCSHWISSQTDCANYANRICTRIHDFGYSLSLGTIHNISARAIEQARAINQAQDLSAIRYGAPDEIFQASQPVLVGVDLQFTYCYLLELAEHRDADTWALALLPLQEQGLQLEESG